MAGTDRNFDPYHKWLGIAPEDQPPHHYRLLGIEPLEDDPDVIANAADGRMAQLKTFQAGKYSAASQKILNEVAAAKVCLLNPEKKAAYDQFLREKLETDGAAAAKAPPPAPGEKTSLEAAFPSFEAPSVVSYVSSHRRSKPRVWQIAAAVGAVAGILVGVLLLTLERDGARTMAQKPDAPTVEAGGVRDGQGESAKPAQPAIPREKEPLPQPPREEAPPVVPEGPPEDDLPPAPQAERTLADLLDPEQAQEPPKSPEETAEAPPADDKAAKLPVPERARQSEIESRIRAIFQKEFAEANSADRKVALAAKLAEQAKQTGDDPEARFVLMRLACEMAAEGGEVRSALAIADRMAEQYEVKRLSVKSYLLGKAVDSLPSGPEASAAVGQLVDTAKALADEAVSDDDFEAAVRLVRLAMQAARKSRDNELIRELTSRSREIDRLQLRFSSIKSALQTLADDPDNAEANLAAGQWYCMTQGNWKKGLPLLAKGSDAALAELARRDLANPTDPKERMKLADAWWDLAEKEPAVTRPQVRGRAVAWYEPLLSAISGLDKAKVEKRLEAAAAADEPSVSRVRGIVQPGNVALASNGAKVIGMGDRTALLIDGKSNTDSGWATSPCPCEWTIVLDKVYLLREIRVKLYDLASGRSRPGYRFVLLVSEDGQTFSVAADHSRHDLLGWQRDGLLPPRPVRAIKFVGLPDPINPNANVHVVEIEAYCIPPNG